MEWQNGDIYLTDDSEAVDIDFVESMLRTSYWAADRPRAVIKASVKNSVSFSMFYNKEQIGFARVVSDAVTFAWIGDVIIAPNFRRRGLGKWMMQCILEHPSIRVAGQQLLKTKDAHGLYQRFGFEQSDCMTRKNETLT